MSGIRVRLVIATLAGLLAAPWGGAAALDEPRSTAVARGTLRLPDVSCPAVEFSVRDGETLRVRDDRTGHSVGFVLAMGDDGAAGATWVPVELAEVTTLDGARLAGAPRATAVGLIESFALPGPKSGTSARHVELQLLELGARPGESPSATGSGTDDECCVSCDGWTVCGSCVDMWCASCCGGATAHEVSQAGGGSRP